MVAVVDRLTPWLFDLSLIAGGWLSIVMIAMIACRQPARRRILARVGVVGALCLGPLRMGISGAQGTGLSGILPIELARVLTVIVGLLIALGICWLILGFWAARRLVATSMPPSERLRELAGSVGLGEEPSRRPTLCVSTRLGRPVLVGVFRPTIVLPASWDGEAPPPEDWVRLALRHELAHADTQDPLFQWLSALAQTLYPAIPPAWWIRQQMLIDQELLADDRAARSLGTSTSSYACSLVELAVGRSVVRSRGDDENARSRSRKESVGSRLLLRVAMLLRCPFPIEREIPRWWRLSVSGAMLVLAVLASQVPSVGPMVATADVVPRPSAQPFRLAEVEIGPDADRSPLRLPAPLPERFALSALVLADPASLAKVVIAGCPIVVPPEVLSDSDAESWHRIALEVDGPEVRLWVDDQPSTTSLEPGSPGPLLSIRPAPGRSLRIRNLLLSPIQSSPEGNPDSTAARGRSGLSSSG